MMLLHLLREKMLLPREWTRTKLLLNMKIIIWIRVIPKDNFTISHLFRDILKTLTMSIMSYNGGAVLAMTGEECVAVCSDLRFGRELQTISTDFPKVGRSGCV